MEALFHCREYDSVEGIETLKLGLRDSSVLLRHEIAYVMGQMSVAAALPVLIELCDNLVEHPMVRHEAGEALHALGVITPEVLACLLRHVDDPCLPVRQTMQLSLEGLQRKCPPEIRAKIKERNATNDPVEAPKLQATDSLVAELQRQLLDESESLWNRYEAMFKLRNMDTKRSAAALAAGLSEKSSALLRHEICFLLGQLQVVETADAMMDRLADLKEADMCRHEAAISLGSLGCVAVVFSGGQAAGGHNVVSGLFDFLKALHPSSQLFGFLDGPKGIFTNRYIELTAERLAKYRNMGGFDLLGSGRDKIESDAQKRSSLEACAQLQLHGLLIIGGDDSMTNAAVLAEYFAANGCRTAVVGSPKTIDGDLKNRFIEVSFGYDTATKTYASSIGSVCADVSFSRDAYHFVRLMGRAASSVTLECALLTRPNLTFIGEEVKAQNLSLDAVCRQVTDLVLERRKLGLNHGVVLVPEGLIEFIPELGDLIAEINELIYNHSREETEQLLSASARKVYELFPATIRDSLFAERDSHGNVQVSKISTEDLLIDVVKRQLAEHQFDGKFATISHFFGYEGRCAMPTNFDANYCYSLGYTAGHLVHHQCNGFMAVVRRLKEDYTQWTPAGIPLVDMMNFERRKGQDVPVIKKFLVDLEGALFRYFAAHRAEYRLKDCYRNLGCIQYEGSAANAPNFMPLVCNAALK
uniref:Pyrophosphate--fructose 6-phosphate 1-phosphotransferase n=1 Tax=Dermatophagoides pteronyssinus TaxID=6956 RepID=A0A6P6Y8J4_DERPT|nr:uncharacterized protein LOC113795320 [Dermatophagoides pteronyssinus]